jgi:Tol biopolymer transport system component
MGKMKTRLGRLRILSLLVTAAICLPTALMGQGSKTSFAGSWVYNAEKSILPEGQPQGRSGGDFTATQEVNLLTVERTMQDRDGQPVTSTSKYLLDGKESVNQSRMGESKSVASWSADGKKLTIKTTRTINRDGQTMTFNSEEVWSLSDPKTLTIEMTMQSPQGERKMTSVYSKK